MQPIEYFQKRPNLHIIVTEIYIFIKLVQRMHNLECIFGIGDRAEDSAKITKTLSNF